MPTANGKSLTVADWSIDGRPAVQITASTGSSSSVAARLAGCTPARAEVTKLFGQYEYVTLLRLTCMATNHGGKSPLTAVADRLGTHVAAVFERFAGADDEAGAEDVSAGTQRRGAVDEEAIPVRHLTPEEHILHELERQGGSMRQSEIVARVDRSESTVSRKLSDLESREAVSRYQLGREKLVYLPGHEPDIAESTLSKMRAD